jgi:hypothetical protein
MEGLMTWLLRGPLTGLPSTPEGTAEPPCGVQKCLKGVGRVTGRVGAFRVLSLAAVLAGGGIFVLGTLQQCPGDAALEITKLEH